MKRLVPLDNPSLIGTKLYTVNIQRQNLSVVKKKNCQDFILEVS